MTNAIIPITISERQISETRQLKLLSGLCSGLRQQQRSGHYCDVTVMVEGVAYRCHKSVLCAVSPYFAAMFAHDMKESRDSVVMLHEVKSELFERLLDCIYEGEDIVSEDNVQDVFEIATLMQIEMLIDRVEEYFKDKLSVENFVDIWYLAKKYCCGRLEQFVWKFMTENFMALSQSGDLSLLPMETFETLLRDDALVSQGEDFICEAALRWVAAEPDSRLEYVPKLISSVRLLLCTPEYLMQRLSKDDMVNKIPELVQAVQVALRFRMYPARKQDSSSFQSTQRASSKLDDVMVVMGGSDSIQYSGLAMRCFSFQRNKWFSLPSLPQNIGPYFALCTYGDDIYVSGGKYHREAFHQFQASTCTWNTLTKLQSGRYQHSMASVADIIYIIGGEAEENENTIYGYQVPSGLWEICGQLLHRVNVAKTAVLGHNILIFGANDGNNIFTNVIQSFNALTWQVTKIKSPELPSVGCQISKCDSSVYIIATDGKITELSQDMKTELVSRLDDFSYKQFSVVQHRRRLYITTSCFENDNLPEVLVFDPSSSKVIETFTTPNTHHGEIPWISNNTGLACAKITIGKHHLTELNRT